MSTSEAVFRELKSKHHGVEINENWISRQIYSGTSNPSQIFKTWLRTDICETGSECLPPEVLAIEQTKWKTTGPLTLQVQSVINIGSSFYSQLKKLNGRELLEPTQQTQFNPEPPPSRMLLLTLTDGTNVITGMEYQPCPQLSTNILPGTKIIVFNIVSRIRMLLFEPGVFRILGGCVEKLRSIYTQERLLKSGLEDGEIEEDSVDEGENINPETTQPVNSTTNVAISNSNQNANSSGVSSSSKHNVTSFGSHPPNYSSHSHNPIPPPAPSPPVHTKPEPSHGPPDNKRFKPVPILSSEDTRRFVDRKPAPASSTDTKKPSLQLEHVYNDSDFEDIEIQESEPLAQKPLTVSDINPALNFPIQIAGTVSSVSSKLLPTPEWTVLVNLSDYSGETEVRLSEQVLSKMIGFSSTEFKKLKPMASSNPGIKSFLRNGLESCQRDLVYLTGLFTIQPNSVDREGCRYEVTRVDKLEPGRQCELKSYIMAKFG